MSQSVPAIFDGSVFRPLEPVELAQGTPVTVQFPVVPQAAASGKDETCQAWRDFLDRMEALPDNSPNDGISNRDHDRILYGK
jgi:predicted DNA-binding antitoxin AbrB/MazE fold protein